MTQMFNPSRILFSTREHSMTMNPYLAQLALSLEALGVSVESWTWRRALLGRYDVIHIHWPEFIVRNDSRLKSFVNRVLSRLLLLRLRLRPIAIVRTVHNLSPHEHLSPAESSLLAAFDSLTTSRVWLNQVGVGDDDPLDVVVPHGDYREWYSKYEKTSAVPGRILFFGLIREYKNVDRLIEEFGKVDQSGLTLHVVGKPRTTELTEKLESLASSDPRVQVQLEFADEQTIALEIQEAGLVVLPYEDLYNSGAALLALSFNRPVLLPMTASTIGLSAEVGPEWVRTFDGSLAVALEHSMAELTAHPLHGEADLGLRDWSRAAFRHLEVYRASLRSVRRGDRNDAELNRQVRNGDEK